MNFIKRYFRTRELNDLESLVGLHEKTIYARKSRLADLRNKRAELGEWDPRRWFPVAGLNTEVNKYNAIVTLQEQMYPQWKSRIEELKEMLR